jgi:muconate cycloisomerase
VPLKKAIRHASHTRTETDNLIVRIVLGDGTVGFGEGVPRDYVTGETIDSAINLLKQSHLGVQLDQAADLPAAVHLAERLKLAPVAGDERQIQGNAARCAVELAVLDAYGRAFGENLIGVTKLIAPDLFEPRERVQYSGIVTSAKGLKLWLLATGYYWFGFKQVKVKVGIEGQNDPARLATLRNRLGKHVSLRVDANEAWTASEAVERIRELEPFGIESVEQPVPHELIGLFAARRKECPVPIMLDESLCGEVDAERAIRENWCDLLNLRLSKCGGYIPTLRLAALARRHNLGYQLGCQVGETAILSAAGRMFATSVAGIRFLEGSYDRYLVREALGDVDLTFRRGGWAPMLTGCGIGVRIDDARLQAITVRREVLVG